jgi:hypothetical protein
MEAVAHNPAFAKKAGVPQNVGQDFSKADKGKTFKQGGNTMASKMNPFAKFEKSGKDVEKKGMKEGSKADMAMDKKQMMMKKGGKAYTVGGGVKASPMGTVRSNPGNINGVAERGKTKGTQVKMAGNTGMKKGGMTKRMNTGGRAC